MAHTTLVSTEVLATQLENPAWAVFDCRHDLAKPGAGAQNYAQAHIPGARFLHLDRDLAAPTTGRNGRHPLPDPQVFARTLEAAGVGATKQVVAYDDKTGVYAARLWWMLRWLGHDNVAVLDGGYAKWTREGRTVTGAVPEPAPAQFSGKPRALSVDVDDVLRSLHNPDRILLDARSAERYRGENETLDPVGGRIPGSINRWFRENVHRDGCFKPAAELRQTYAAILGGLPPDAVVHTCGSGVSACHNLLAMEYAGLQGSRLYPGSWSEWCSDPARPTEKG